jgi:hypothetical protein
VPGPGGLGLPLSIVNPVNSSNHPTNTESTSSSELDCVSLDTF